MNIITSIFFFTKATYLYGNYSPAAVRNFGETVPLRGHSTLYWEILQICTQFYNFQISASRRTTDLILALLEWEKLKLCNRLYYIDLSFPKLRRYSTDFDILFLISYKSNFNFLEVVEISAWTHLKIWKSIFTLTVEIWYLRSCSI